MLMADSSAWTLLSVHTALVGGSVLSASGEIYGTACPAPGTGLCVVKWSASGAQIFASPIAGSASVEAIALDAGGNAYIAGLAGPTGAGFVTTPGSYEPNPPGAPDPFLCKFDGNNGRMIFCTFVDAAVIGSSSLTVDSAGNSYVAGKCGSDIMDLCIEKLNTPGSALIYRTNVSGSILDLNSLAVDANGNLFATDGTGALTKLGPSGTVVGAVKSPAGYLPDALALDPTGNPQVLLESGTGYSGPVRVRRYSADLATILFDTPLYAGRYSLLQGMAIDSAGTTNLFGTTNSIDLPQVQPTKTCSQAPAGADVFLVRLGNNGAVLQSTFLEIQLGSGALLSVVATPQGASALGYISSNFEVLTVGPASSTIALGCLGNGASFTSMALAPNEIVSLFGAGLGPVVAITAQPDAMGFYPFQLSGTQVTFDGVAAPLLYVSNSQINLVNPGALQGKTTTHICVLVEGASTNCIDAPVQLAAPGIFTSGTPLSVLPYAAAVNQDNTINSEQNPAPISSIVSLFVTGLGPMTPSPVDGGLNLLPPAAQNLTIQVLTTQTSPSGGPAPDGLVDVLYAGPAPLEVEGLGQINVRVPAPPGPVPGSSVTFKVMVTSADQTTFVVSAEVAIYTEAN